MSVRHFYLKSVLSLLYSFLQKRIQFCDFNEEIVVLVVESSLSRTPLMLMMCALIVSSVITWKNEEKNFSKKSSHASENFLFLSFRSFFSFSSSLHLSLVLKKEDKDGSEDFEKRRRREKEEERV